MPPRVNNAQSQCCYMTMDPKTRVSENGSLFCSTNGPYNDLISRYRTKNYSPVQNQGPLYWKIIKGLRRYRTKGRFTGTEPSPFRGTDPKALHQCRTKNPSPVQNQGPLYWNIIKGLRRCRTKGRSTGTEPSPFTGTEPKALH